MTRVFGHFLSHTKRAAILEVVQEFHIRELPFVKSQPEDNHEVNYFTAISLINRGTLYFKLSLSTSSRRIQSAWGIGRKRKKKSESRANQASSLRRDQPDCPPQIALGSLCSPIFLALSLQSSAAR